MFIRPPEKLKQKVGIPPGKDIFISAQQGDSYAQAQIENYIDNINNLNINHYHNQKLGNLIPFTKEKLENIIVNFGVNPESINPFHWEKLDIANQEVTRRLISTRDSAAKENKNIVIDMVNMRLAERNKHRIDILKSLNDLSNNPQI